MPHLPGLSPVSFIFVLRHGTSPQQRDLETGIPDELPSRLRFTVWKRARIEAVVSQVPKYRHRSRWFDLAQTSPRIWFPLGAADVDEPRLAMLADCAVFCRRFEPSAASGAFLPCLAGLYLCCKLLITNGL